MYLYARLKKSYVNTFLLPVDYSFIRIELSYPRLKFCSQLELEK